MEHGAFSPDGTRFVDVHHLRPRSEGGKNTLENLITLCTAHHRATHRGELIIETIGEIGGHFGANLGACEIAVALHSVLESPRDKILWDVGLYVFHN